MMSFSFWYRWLLIASVGFAVFGLVVAVFPHNPILAMWHHAAVDVFFDGAPPAEAAAYGTFLFGPLGGTIAGFYVMQCFIVWKPFYKREVWAWHAVLWATLAWFVIDSSVSLYHGAYFNFWMINLFALGMIGLPLGMTYRHVRPPSRRADAHLATPG